jgi:peptidyl-prolyl cis-trans isomerase D
MAKKPNQKVVTKKHLARLERERQQNRLILVVSMIVLVLVIGLIGYGILDQTVLQSLRPVAKVGNTAITVKDFVAQASFNRIQLVNQYQQEQQLAQYFGNDPSVQQNLSTIESELTDTTTLGTNVINQMIDNVIIREEAARRNITVTKEEVDKGVQAAFGYYSNGTPSPTITPTDVTTATVSAGQNAILVTMVPTITPTYAISPTPTITSTPTIVPTNTPISPTVTPTSAVPTATGTPAPTATPYTLTGYQKTFNDYIGTVKKYNISEDGIRKLIENNLYRDKVLAAITADLKPEQDEVWARHILVPDEATAAKVEDALKKRTDWATLAAQYSTDTSNKDKGGDLGWFAKGAMVAEFEKMAFSMSTGSISSPVKTQFGYHIIQVVGHEVRPLTATQFTQLKQTTFQTWLTGAVSKHKDIQKFDTVWASLVPTIPTLPPTQVVPASPN